MTKGRYSSTGQGSFVVRMRWDVLWRGELRRLPLEYEDALWWPIGVVTSGEATAHANATRSERFLILESRI